MRHPSQNRPKPGARVVIVKEPPDIMLGLPDHARIAISEILGKPILLTGYDADGRAELEFRDRNRSMHFIYVDPIYIKAAK